jgi:hypothetical protein
MKNKFLKGLVASFALAVSGLANAGLIIDNGTYTTDTNTGLNWLDTSYTDGLSYGTVLGMVNGGSLDDWRIATTSEVLSLLINTLDNGDQLLYGEGVFVNNSSLTPFASLVETMGGSPITSLDNWIAGRTLDFNQNQGRQNIVQIGYTKDGQNHYFRNGSWGTDAADVNLSTWIVRNTTEVPEPSTLAIFALSLMGLASRKFKKQA